MLPFFFFNDTATTEIYTLSLHDALPICLVRTFHCLGAWWGGKLHCGLLEPLPDAEYPRSEEHTSELQSQSNLVCRLLLEKKKQSRARLLADIAQRSDGLASLLPTRRSCL